MTGEKNTRCKRALLIAYACSPYRGSEAGVGWHRVFETAKHFETWVICKKQIYKEDILRYIKENGEVRNLHFHFVSQTRFEELLIEFPVLYFVPYNLWHRRAFRVAKKIDKELRFDIIHQVTLCGFREPGYSWKLDAPFIWGPVGGTQNFPWRFLTSAGLSGAIREGVRSVINNLQFRYSPRVRKAVKRSSILLAANSVGVNDFKKIRQVSPICELDVGVTNIFYRLPKNKGCQEPMKILWSGSFQHHKALHLILSALGKLPASVKYELKILGSGALQKRWQRMAKKEGIEVHCTWTGWLPHHEAMAQYDWADLFVFTSLRDTCGSVVVEALSRGVPVICFDHQGVGDVVTPECGIKIPVTTPRDAISQLTDAIASLAHDRSEMETLSHGATERAREYLWSVKGEKMAKIYNDVIGIDIDRKIIPEKNHVYVHR